MKMMPAHAMKPTIQLRVVHRGSRESPRRATETFAIERSDGLIPVERATRRRRATPANHRGSR